jgi:ribosome maturation factor RimP
LSKLEQQVADIARITEVVEPEAKALGFDLVRVRYFKGGEIGDEEHTLQIMAEDPATGQLLIADCAALSRRISDVIDALEEQGDMLITDAYRLEVSSPGIDRPLTRLKDFVQWSGHEARVQLNTAVDGNRKALQGVLDGAQGDMIALTDRKSGLVHFAFAEVEYAKLILTDQLIAATRPLDASGVDEILEEQED